MAFRFTDMAHVVRREPEKARLKIRVVLKGARGNVVDAAERLGVSRRTFDRWCSALWPEGRPPT